MGSGLPDREARVDYLQPLFMVQAPDFQIRRENVKKNEMTV